MKLEPFDLTFENIECRSCGHTNTVHAHFVPRSENKGTTIVLEGTFENAQCADCGRELYIDPDGE